MGWGRYLLLGTVGQQFDLEEQRSGLDQLRRQGRIQRVKSQTSARQLEELQDECDQLKLYVAALMRLLTADPIIASRGHQADAFSRPPLVDPLRQHRVGPAAGSSRRGSVT